MAKKPRTASLVSAETITAIKRGLREAADHAAFRDQHLNSIWKGSVRPPQTPNGSANRGVVSEPQETNEFSALLSWATKEMKGKERRVIELVVSGLGRRSLVEIAADPVIEWDANDLDSLWESTRKRINKKIKAKGWILLRDDNAAVLVPIKKIGTKKS